MSCGLTSRDRPTHHSQAASKALEEESPVVSIGDMVTLAARKMHAEAAVATQVAAYRG